MNKKSGLILALAATFLFATGAAFAANTLTVNNTCALGGTNFGLDIHADPSGAVTNSVYVESDHPNAETHMLIRFRLKASALDAPASGAGRNFRLLNMIDNSDATNPHKILFLQRQSTTGNWRLAVWGFDTSLSQYTFIGGMFLFNYHAASDIQVQCEWTQDTGSGNGIVTCTKVGSGSTFTDSTVHDAGRVTDTVQAGFFDFDSFGNGANGGDLCFDEYESYR